MQININLINIRSRSHNFRREENIVEKFCIHFIIFLRFGCILYILIKDMDQVVLLRSRSCGLKNNCVKKIKILAAWYHVWAPENGNIIQI